MSARAARRFLVPVMSVRQRLVFGVLMLAWVAALVFFWAWWLRSDHLVTPFGMVVNSAMFVWSLLLPGVFFAHLARMARTDPALGLPALRVAIIVTKAPSEPWEVVRRTLRAMLRQEMPYPYDVWLADEAPSAETLHWCEANGVRVSTRQGHPDYHRPAWPRRTKSKEGNLAFFYDHWGYRNYHVVAQLDADHRPTPTYLRAMVGPFIDPDVGYVAAPSICDANATACWAARGRLFKEAVFHGPQQAGGHHAIPPMCIGSHYAIRTQALREIGGIGPELAEDFSTSLMMNAFGWRGVFALDAEAHGDGPETFADFATQEFQWARSLSDVTLHHNRRYWRGLDLPAKVKLGFGEAWYPLYALHMLAASLFPVVALVTKTPWADVRLLDFFAHVLVVSLVLLVALAWVRAQGWLRPTDAPLISWETVLFLFARWPWVLRGVAQSWAGWLLRRRFGFKVTPKGIEDATPLGLRAIVPYLLVAGVCAATAVVQGHPGAAQGYYYFCLLNALTYLVVAAAVIALHLHESGALSWAEARRLAVGPLVATAAVGVLVAAAVGLRGELAARALIPPRVWEFGAEALRGLSARTSLTEPAGAPAWLVLGIGLALVGGSLLSAARAGGRDPDLGGTATSRRVDMALIAIAALSGLVFLILAELWRRGDHISWAGLAAVLAASAVLGAASGAGRRLAVPPELRAAFDVAARDAQPATRDGEGKRRGDPRRTTIVAAAQADTRVGAPPVPVPRRARSAQPGRFTLHSILPGGPAPGPSAPPVEAEIEWWSGGGRSGFRLRPLHAQPSAILDERSPEVAWSGSGPPPRTGAASRAHAILYDRLVLTGWEPCGQGEAWYADRFRRSLAPSRAPVEIFLARGVDRRPDRHQLPPPVSRPGLSPTLNTLNQGGT